MKQHEIRSVALSYQQEKDMAPKVIAKGKGRVAENIIEKAKEHQIPILEDSSLVELLSQLDIHQEIPPELYQVVAEILVFVYQLDKGCRGDVS
ncbi:EscU/YscU/HrcU family type III secretion system export apparatus switch protein [Microaerobacter geothermalis]|uniref:EscU/YscU/HrcU family type III secretion system export apparatus switch protein n=1 Tax=Microaerobacter geothermalis TaxID=674972 RepID=UPI001F309DAB|nr:EscU/YscU/HrcU family type III secretion system export apparatus switch protein [Microaerobacter geothermalis]MCF6094340.1 EscU/YscU/HrcU family type III secretion system export apparatus switch protein [Microaerobacter geothermalis]